MPLPLTVALTVPLVTALPQGSVTVSRYVCVDPGVSPASVHPVGGRDQNVDRRVSVQTVVPPSRTTR
ncbi:hypothetical protein GCM10025868_14800 [Angustibacter aerolatus]|uniref:Secreted protein n=1 Tax=Angustibacter aerolatus TaxID=1162965 RepID=A0ABQ6JHB5_9ACTN|nr:hypothetical protein GCM10025868_14800 [Angustibacter aerolatus]